jgi:hypothetical protein
MYWHSYHIFLLDFYCKSTIINSKIYFSLSLNLSFFIRCNSVLCLAKNVMSNQNLNRKHTNCRSAALSTSYAGLLSTTLCRNILILLCQEDIQLANGRKMILLSHPANKARTGTWGLPPTVKLESCDMTWTIKCDLKSNKTELLRLFKLYFHLKSTANKTY